MQWFYAEVLGPMDIGGAMCNFVRFQDEDDNLYTPVPTVHVACRAPDGGLLGIIHPGDKGVGLAEFCPLMGQTGKYIFQVQDDLGEPLSEEFYCDLSLDFNPAQAKAAAKYGIGAIAPVDPSKGQYHKAFISILREGEPAPEPPEPEECEEYVTAIYDQIAFLQRVQEDAELQIEFLTMLVEGE